MAILQWLAELSQSAKLGFELSGLKIVHPARLYAQEVGTHQS